MHTALRILAGLVALECIFGFFAFLSSTFERTEDSARRKLKDVFFAWNIILGLLLAVIGVGLLITFAAFGSFSGE